MAKQQNTDEVLGKPTKQSAPIEDAPLAGPVEDEDAAFGIEDATPDITPEDFDFEEFIAGARPVRRTVRLVKPRFLGDAAAGAHIDALSADLQAVLKQIEAAEADEQPTDELEARFQQIKAELDPYYATFVVEARSTEWVKNLEKQAKKQHGLDLKKPEDRVTLLLRQIAGQIVTPSNVTPEALRRLFETNEAQVDALWRACGSANRAAGVVPGFSRGRSATTRNG